MAHTPYDPSRDYIRYPTFAPLPDSRAQCKECGGSVFEFLLPQWKPVCLQCGTELPLPGIPQQPVQSEQPESEFHDIDFRTAFEQAWAEFDLAFTPNTPDQQNVQEKPDIQFCDGFCHTAFLRPDGTVRAVGANFDGECDVEDWSGIQAIAAGLSHTVGLCTDGTVKAVGRNDSGQCNVQDWTGIRAIAAGDCCTVGLCMDGTVKAAGIGSHQCCQVQNWSNVIRIWAGKNYTAALTADGTVLCTDPSIERELR